MHKGLNLHPSLPQNLDQKKTKDVKMQTEKFIQTLKTTGQTTDYDVNKIIKLHNARMDEFDGKSLNLILPNRIFHSYCFDVLGWPIIFVIVCWLKFPEYFGY